MPPPHPEYRKIYAQVNKERVRERANEARRKRRLDPEYREREREQNRKYDRKPRSKEDLKKHRVSSVYRIDIERYNALLALPCSICGGVSTVLDHCHRTGKVRAGLCNRCNVGLGMLNDDAETVEAAARYLRLHEADAA